MPRHAPALECSPEDKETLVAISKSRHEELRIVERAQIILASLEGKEIQQVAQELGVSIHRGQVAQTVFLIRAAGAMGSAAEWQAGQVRCRLSQSRPRPAGTTSSAPPVALGWTRYRGEAGGQCVRGVAGVASRRHLPAKAAERVCEHG